MRRSARSRESRPHSGRKAPIGVARWLALGAAVLGCLAIVPAPAAGSKANPFGIVSFSMQTTEASSGSSLAYEPYLFTQAGGHPFALTSTIQFTTREVGETVAPTRDPKDVIIDLPPGLLADPQAVASCPPQSVPCPTATQVGVFVLHSSALGKVLGPIVELTPAPGEPAELGLETPFGDLRFQVAGRIVRTEGGYGLALVASGLPGLGIVSLETTLWGVPAASAHDAQRGLLCTESKASKQWSCQGGGAASGIEPAAFLTLPSSCSGAQSAVAWADSWEQPGRYVQAQSTLPAMTHCDRLPFSPEITVRPETLLADEPVGVDLDIRAPQIEHISATASTPPLSEATVTLPQGMSIDAGVAGGLQACNATGPAAIEIPTGLNAAGGAIEPGELGVGEEIGPSEEPQLAPGHCPNASTIGTAQASTPLLAHPIEGHVYIAKPGCGGPGQQVCTEQDALDGNLYRLYVELGGNAPDDQGVALKLEASVQTNPATGQLTVRLNELPQLPLSELSIHLFGGPSGLLANPATCGPARTSTDLQAWSTPTTPDANPSSSYEVTGCADPSSFHPGLLAGSVNANAGAFTPFTLSVAREDREPYLADLQLHAPPGLSAMLASVPLCPEALASTGKCSEASRIGDSEVAAGAGSQPLYMPGDIYLTAGYEGAPFGLSIVTDAVAGPLDLGLLVIRARIDIDPETGALTITSDPLPQIVLGIPLRIQRVTLNLDRPQFIFNATSCEAEQLTATVTDVQGTSAEPSSRFALGGCANLAFKPALKASTSAHTSFAGGASLDIKLTFPRAERSAEANLAEIKIALPKQLPSRLTTLQKACPQATFDANPAACPPASVVGIAAARTPVLSTQMTGPVYFVTHGRKAFPSPVLVLQGDGVRLDLRGATIIGKAGGASVLFDAIPDVPMASIELYLPQGSHSLLSANTNLCALSKTVTAERNIAQRVDGRTVRRTVTVRERLAPTLPMETELVAHNGAAVHQTTKVKVNGCQTSKTKMLAP
jgi:hypothetical protein